MVNHDIIQENKKQPVSSVGDVRSGAGRYAIQLQDNRPASGAQKKLADAMGAKTAAQKKENKTGLPGHLKSGVESLSGISLDDVKVHYHSDKPAQLNAYAYAQGTDIHIAPGQEKHLPHEAWHVVQQKQGRVKPTMQMKGKVNMNDDKMLEKEADVKGEMALQLKGTCHCSEIPQRKTTGGKSDAILQRAGWGEWAGRGLGFVAGAGLATLGTGLATGAAGLVAGGAVATGVYYGTAALAGLAGAALLGKGGQKIDQAMAPAGTKKDPYANLKSQAGLDAWYHAHGGNNQNTLSFIIAGGKAYMIEQQTTGGVRKEAENLEIEYYSMRRSSGWHAESRFVRAFTDNGISTEGASIWVNKDICFDCAKLLQENGVLVKTATNNVQYPGWKGPNQEDSPFVANPNTTIKTHKTEVQVLNDRYDYEPGQPSPRRRYNKSYKE